MADGPRNLPRVGAAQNTVVKGASGRGKGPSRIPKGWAQCPDCKHLVQVPRCENCQKRFDPYGVMGDDE